jgi:hypothetical protein
MDFPACPEAYRQRSLLKNEIQVIFNTILLGCMPSEAGPLLRLAQLTEEPL